MSSEPPILHREVIILLLVHFFVDDILLRHAQRAAGSSLVDFGCSSGRLYPGLKAAVTPSRCGNIGPGQRHSAKGQTLIDHGDVPLLVLFMSALSLDDLGRGDGSRRRHFRPTTEGESKIKRLASDRWNDRRGQQKGELLI